VLHEEDVLRRSHLPQQEGRFQSANSNAVIDLYDSPAALSISPERRCRLYDFRTRETPRIVIQETDMPEGCPEIAKHSGPVTSWKGSALNNSGAFAGRNA
jgi:hypothetical protein